MFKIKHYKSFWEHKDFNVFLDQYDDKGALYGWLVPLSENQWSIEVCDEQGIVYDCIQHALFRPKLGAIYPSIKAATNCGFMIDLSQLDVDKHYKIKMHNSYGDSVTIAIFTNAVPLLYVHIAKTAGSTINNVVSSWFEENQSLIHVESKSDWSDYVNTHYVKFLSGHRPYKEFIKNDIVKSLYSKAISFREPYAHVISHIAWIRALAESENKDRFLAHPKYIQDLSVKLSNSDLSCAKTLKNLIAKLNVEEFRLLDNCQLRYIRTAITKEKVDVTDVTDSIHNLKDFDFVGDDSNISGFLARIANRYGIKYSITGRRDNVLSQKFGLDIKDERIKAALYPLVQYDLKLYEYIKTSPLESSKCKSEKEPKIFFNDRLHHTKLNSNFLRFINEPAEFLKKRNLHLDLSFIKNQKKQPFPVYLMADAIANSRVTFISPFSGEPCESSHAIAPNTYRFSEENRTFFLSTFISPKMQHSLAFFNIFIPENNMIVSYDYREDKSDFLLGHEGQQKYLLEQYDNICKAQPAPPENTVGSLVSNFGLAHIGHCLWQDISIFYSLLKRDVKRENVTFAYVNNFYTENVANVKRLQLPELQFRNSNELFEYSKKNKLLPIIFTDSIISEAQAQTISKICYDDAASDLKSLLDTENRKVVLSLRSGYRCCKNEAGIYSRLISVLSQEDSDIVFFIDGMNSSFDFNVDDKHQIAKLKTAFVDELSVAELISKQNPTANIVNIIGRSFNDSIAVSSAANVIISPWGAGLVKYKWLCNHPNVFIYGSEATLSESHLHKRLYDEKKFRENVAPSTYFKGTSKFVQKQQSRDDNYTISEEEFVSEVRNFFREST